MIVNLKFDNDGDILTGELVCDVCGIRPPEHVYKAYNPPNEWNGGHFYNQYLCGVCVRRGKDNANNKKRSRRQ